MAGEPKVAGGVVRWGIIGVGDVTEVKSGPALQRVPDSEVRAVMRRDAARAADYARRHGVPRWYDDAQALLDDPEVNAIYVATPPDSHADYARRAAEAGKPVYVEKPMARDHAEYLAMIEACERAGVPLFVAYYRRALPRFERVRALLASGRLGEIRTVSVTLRRRPAAADAAPDKPWRVLPEIAGGGYAVDLGSHMLDLVDHLLGPIAVVHGAAANVAGLYPAEDLVTGRFTLASGAQGVGVWNSAAPDDFDAIEIVGSRGRVAFPCFEARPTEVVAEDGRETFLLADPPHVQEPLLRTVVDALLGRGSCPSTGASAARTTRVLDALLADVRRS